ncbi:MAG: arginine decarboxylase [Cyanobacteria bacterium QS_8_64_29]|nr:MAG: arginine decarboxylase [Cyanobacteria bacterium QS_8_64_29]
MAADPSTRAAASDHQAGGAWHAADSEALYGVRQWGEPYFSVNAAGRVTVSPCGDRGPQLDLYEIVGALRERGLNPPLLVCFSDILADRWARLQACFERAITHYAYPGAYYSVFPLKCNQYAHCRQALAQFGSAQSCGLEVGSKPELAIALATFDAQPGTAGLLVCNGYKDREYIEMALLAQRLGPTPALTLEHPSELATAIELSRDLGIRPLLGVRAKLSASGSGHWGHSSGDHAKFGLTAPQLLEVVERLQQAGMLDCLQLLHFHAGSQIAAIGTIKAAIREASQLYVELRQLGVPLRYLDVGGGLAVDYDGSKRQGQASKNYNMQNYANDIVAEVKEACEARSVPVPTLISESGRAIAAHHAVLAFDVLGSSEPPTALPARREAGDPRIIRNLWETYDALGAGNYQEAYHDAVQFREEAVGLFDFGYLSLAERARAERLYWACCDRLLALVRECAANSEERAALEMVMAAIYYVNCSIFRSAPDSWAIKQLFPIMPLHRLDEAPTQRGVLGDLSCDSDGQIDRFVSPQTGQSERVLPLHPLDGREPYYLGMFLVGTYQQIMGNAHNLFGHPNVACIRATADSYSIERIEGGDTIADILQTVGYSPADLLERLRQRTERHGLDPQASQRLLRNYRRSLERSTYLSER